MPYRASFACLWCGRAVVDPRPRRPRGLRPALPGLRRPGRRERLPPLPAEDCAGRARRPRARRPPGRHRPASTPRRSGRATERPPIPGRRDGRLLRGARRPSTTTGISGAAATPTARSTTRPGRPSSTRRRCGSTASRSDGRDRRARRRHGLVEPAPRGEAVSCRSTTPPSAPLDLARDRLLAHGLRAHIHVRDAWAEPDRQVDGVFCGFWLSHVPRDRLAAFLALVRRWLKPGGSLLAFVDSRAGSPVGRGRPAARRRGGGADGESSGAGWPTGASSGSSRSLYEPDELAAGAARCRVRHAPR